MASSIIGKRYGALVVIDEFNDFINGQKRKMIKCKCDCGNEKNMRKDSVTSGRTISCGCYAKSGVKTLKHGDRKMGEQKRLYNIWANMKQRCNNSNNPHFYKYGGRGISICDEWNNSYETFKEWAIDNGYEEDLTIDRIDVNGDYTPKNCRWATNKEQQYNKRQAVLLTHNNKTQCLEEWAIETGLTYSCIHKRYTMGWTTEKILETPVSKKHQRFKLE